MNKQEYWRKRSEQIAARQFKKADEYSNLLKKEYQKAIQSINRDIQVFYEKFADNNGIVDMAEARRILDAGELKEFKMTLQEFIEKAKNNGDKQWTQQLNNVYYKTRISRFEALQTQINQQVEMLTDSKQNGTKELLKDVYKDTYYQNLYEIHKGTGIGVSFAHIDDKGVEKVLSTKLDGRNWSERIWDNRTILKKELYTKLSQAFIRGDSSVKTAKDLAHRMDVSFSNAHRLIQTETAFFSEQGTFDSYQESGVVEKYEILATLDSRTTDICRKLDGKIFKLSEKEVSITAPPFHVRCRTTTIPYFDDEEDIGQRAAKKGKKAYYVSADTTYEKWHKTFVDIPENEKLKSLKKLYNEWDNKDITKFASNILNSEGIDLEVQRHQLRGSNGQCRMDVNNSKMEVLSYELNSNDIRKIDYQVKTVLHELYHAKSNGVVHDIGKISFQEWAYIDDIFAETTAHYISKEIGITREISPSYSGHLVEALPKLKKLEEFKDCNTIIDFGKVAFKYRFGSKLNAEWEPIYKILKSSKNDIIEYSKSYIGYMKDNKFDLVDKLLENSPQYLAYKDNMVNDIDSAIMKVSNRDALCGNEKMVFENALIITMNRLGVK